MMNGRQLKTRSMQLMYKHRMAPVARPLLPLFPTANCVQIVEGIAASADIDSDRTSLAAGSLTWSNDIPLLVRHDTSKVAGRILGLRYDANGSLFIRAQIDDPLARCMPAFSIAATIAEGEVHNEDSASFYFLVTRALITEISVTDRPANAHALVLSRRDVSPVDCSGDEALAAAARAQKALEQLCKSWSLGDAVPAKAVQGNDSREQHFTRNLAPAAALIYGDVPAAMLSRPRTQFTALVARLPIEGD